MTRTRWRIMACLLTVGLGGFVVLADDNSKAGPGRVARRNTSSSPIPALLAPTAQAPDITPDPQTIAMTPEPPPISAASSLVPPLLEPTITPVIKADADAETTKFSSGDAAVRIPEPPPMVPVVAPPPLPTAPPPVPVVQAPPLPEVEAPRLTDPIAPPPPIKIKPEPRNLPTVQLAVPPPVNPTDAQAAPALESREPPKAAVAEPHSAAPFPWKLVLEVVGGMTQLEVRRGDELLMKVQCEKFDLHAPSGGIHATGKVVVSGPCVEARCDRLMIAWQSGQVALDGSVRMTFQSRGGAVHEMRAESVTFRLTGANTPVDFTAREVQQIVAPPKH